MQADLQITVLINSDIRRTPYSEKELQSSGFELPHEQTDLRCTDATCRISPDHCLGHLQPIHRRRGDPAGIARALAARIDPRNGCSKLLAAQDPDRGRRPALHAGKKHILSRKAAYLFIHPPHPLFQRDRQFFRRRYSSHFQTHICLSYWG